MTYKANIISHDNGVGLTHDIAIIKKLLSENGVESNFIETFDKFDRPIRKFNPEYVRMNIFIEHFVPTLVHYADVNILIPNPEWWWRCNDSFLPKFDLIMCKTKDGENTFRKYNPNSVYTGFIANDNYLPEVKKGRYFIHTAGRSSAKGTDTVFKTWKENYDLDTLVLTKSEKFDRYRKNVQNIKTLFGRIDFPTFNKLQNECAFHVCPSEVEGFGHYLWEAMSCKSVVITTDAPPMNEIITDRRFLVNYKIKRVNNLGVSYYVDQQDLLRKAKFVQNMTDKDINEVGEQNREKFLQQNKEFKKIFKQITTFYRCSEK